MTEISGVRYAEKVVVHVDPDLMDLIPGFLENRRNDVRVLQEALSQGDSECIRKLGHQMKGVGGGYGFDAITDLGRALEQAGKVRDFETAGNVIRELADYLENVEVAHE